MEEGFVYHKITTSTSMMKTGHVIMFTYIATELTQFIKAYTQENQSTKNVLYRYM